MRGKFQLPPFSDVPLYGHVIVVGNVAQEHVFPEVWRVDPIAVLHLLLKCSELDCGFHARLGSDSRMMDGQVLGFLSRDELVFRNGDRIADSSRLDGWLPFGYRGMRAPLLT